MKPSKYLPLRKATLCFLVKKDEILLAMKKQGFGSGKWNGVGGKPESDETIEQATKRETKEEIGVTLVSMRHVATLDFIFPSSPKFEGWNQQVWVYLASAWEGGPIETEEMAPRWFKQADIPYRSMWEDDKYWLPEVLGAKFVTATFSFNEATKLTDYTIETKQHGA